MVSCTTTKVVQVPVETIKKEVIHKVDSLVIRDSIDRWREGDTVYIVKWHTRYSSRVDTFLKCDTIPVVQEVVIEKKVNELYWWQKTLMWLGVIALGIFLWRTK